ncbi:hypothetical protein NDU88_003621 [Pleurodeles waltl]|uniref:Uncharacterized protein n=1 Tax=Pleurodeles waltl TaxID=8319 RepID=A0AAV7M3W7_PLEWA|nr:hypothetical protein NDU88_003621 [Pleurodeles waltl]
MEPSKVVKALKVLQDEGREDLIKEGVLEEAWVGLRKPKRLSAEGVSAAVAACTSPQQTFKKFKLKNAPGQKVAHSPEVDVVAGVEVVGPQPLGGVRRLGASRLPRRQGSSLVRRVTAGGRGSGPVTAVKVCSRVGAQARFAHAQPERSGQTRSPSERGDELIVGAVEERHLGGTSKMAAPSMVYRPISEFLKESQLGEPGCVGDPDRACAVWIVGHSFVRWAEKQASSRNFGRQLGLEGARIKLSWVGKSGMRWGCRSRSQTPTSRRLSDTGGGPLIPGRRREVENKEKPGDEEDEAFSESTTVEEETGIGNGQQGAPRRTPPQED